MLVNDLSIRKYNTKHYKLEEPIYEYVSNLDEVFLLSQYIWNQNMSEKELQEAIELANKYKVEIE